MEAMSALVLNFPGWDPLWAILEWMGLSFVYGLSKAAWLDWRKRYLFYRWVKGPRR